MLCRVERLPAVTEDRMRMSLSRALSTGDRALELDIYVFDIFRACQIWGSRFTVFFLRHCRTRFASSKSSSSSRKRPKASNLQTFMCRRVAARSSGSRYFERVESGVAQESGSRVLDSSTSTSGMNHPFESTGGTTHSRNPRCFDSIQGLTVALA